MKKELGDFPNKEKLAKILEKTLLHIITKIKFKRSKRYNPITSLAELFLKIFNIYQIVGKNQHKIMKLYDDALWPKKKI